MLTQSTQSSPIFCESPTQRDSSVRRIQQQTVCIRPPTAMQPATKDAALLAILDAPLQPGENAHLGFQRKEHELGAVFAGLSVLEARMFHTRLANPKQSDELANKFARLTIERRHRLISFLADARRREAQGLAQRAR